ncbi:hypothetical protein LOTGIDRAFT_169833 [Lottia gigantea]|uniref:Beta-1,4-glucuronyltransferase 1 n=1 Tax=Lottia gigantea TaxID=225164 RepID=V3ZFV4_LOTGI|nr:hypothetical protein LOTGIDRAFT_169833 [Lottia gigantea]ESO83002.1 hypothetical protein LOTGIDRAFT_169833 [Lottia gigantea]
MTLLSRLESKEVEEYKRVNKVLLEIRNQVKNWQRLDKSGTYNLIPNLLTAKSRLYRNSENITIVTQCSSNHLHNLVELTERWEGPVSVTVFTYDTDIEFTMKSLAYYHVCNKRIHRSVTIHVVFPIKRAPLTDDQQIIESFDCSSPPVKVSNDNYEIQDLEYPHNLLRNQAIKNSRTTHVLVLDVDMLPSENIGNVFRNIQQKYSFLRNSKFVFRSAYVIPAFELKDGHKIPSDKQELLKMWDDNLVRPFYKEMCWKCQKYTDYEQWRQLTPGDSSYYNVEWHDPWEPFFIVAKSLPLYDERFKQYGFNRISQVCEMYIAGYQFTVLSDVFLVHKGFKQPGHFHKTKDEEQQKNKLLFRKFKEELKTKYDDSIRRC